ncbi:carboxypeptidase regulatory-like domain-containing protein, partial [Candidatus Woesearchaeota archaeon]|nr:carboxypeptidase regulatory-like domain-containing protein [Candidatus Woesearchaeota archaeon]
MTAKKFILITVLLISLALAISTIYSADEDEWCCITQTPDPCDLRNQSSCAEIGGTFHINTLCIDIPECDYDPGCCVDTCTPVDYPASCSQGNFNTNACDNVSQCQEGCCYCYAPSPIGATCPGIFNLEDCQSECQDRNALYAYVDTSITELATCELQCGQIIPPPGTITGFILDSQGNPIEDVYIVPPAGITVAYSAADGSYTFTDAPPGDFLIQLSKEGYKPTSSTAEILPGQTIQHNITLPSFIGGAISGIVRDSETTEGLEEVLIIAIGPDVKDTISLEDGNYSITDLDQGTYTVIAKKDRYIQSETEDIEVIDEETTIFNINLIPEPFGKIQGTIKNTEGQLIPNSQIMINGVIEIKTPTGNFEKELPASTEGITYYIKALAPGYSQSNPQEIIILKGETPPLEDFILSPIAQECIYPASPQVETFEANHIKGEKALKLNWTPQLNCHSNIGGYTIFRNDEQIAFIPVTTSPYNHSKSYIDNNVEWQTTYTYSIIVTYIDEVIRNSSKTYTPQIRTGDPECEGTYTLQGFKEFCLSISVVKQCDEFNKAKTIDTCDTEEGFRCSGPDLSGVAYCKDSGPCNPIDQEALPFGLYYTEEMCNQNTYCYYDYSDTIVDSCYLCTQETTCFDYRSESACTTDNCLAAQNSDCTWQETTYTDLNKGICYETNYNGTDYCHLCSSSELFQNIGCTQDICSKLGSCYSDGTSCSSCNQTACESYTTQEACIGENEIQISDCSETVTPSDDACSLGKCKWNSTEETCYKDGNDDDQPDCQDSLDQCKTDTNAPTTKAPDTYLITTLDTPITLTSDFDADILTYCIYKSEICCPSEEIKFENGIAEIIPSESETLEQLYLAQGHGEYNIRYYATDTHDNQEQLKSSPVYIDFSPPSINIEYEVITTDQILDGFILSDLIFTINASETVTCSDTLIESITKDPFPQQLSSETGTSWQTSYRVEDGDYQYTVTCSDPLGNTNTTIIDIEVDAWPFIRIINPYKPSTKGETDIEFIVKTNGTANCSWHYESQVVPFQTANQLHTLPRTLPRNTYYDNIAVECTETATTNRKDKARFLFTIDQLAPITITTLKIGQGEYTYNNTWTIWTNDPVEISFECIETLPLSFGCSEEIKFCKHGTTECYPGDTYTTPFTISDNRTVCYQSKDKGENIEEKKCSQVIFGAGIGLNLVNPPYQVSPVPVFDVVIDTQSPYIEECEFSTYDKFTYGRGVTFNRTGVNRFTYFNFDDIDPDRPRPYYMYIRCKDNAGAITSPALITLYYDPDKPIIIDSHAKPNPLVQGTNITLHADTTPPTICKYDSSASSYNNMIGEFPGWKQWGYPNQPIFSGSHERDIDISGYENGKYSFYLACQNRAGLISDTSTIDFTIDRGEEAQIRELLPKGSTNSRDITLTIITNRDAACFLENGQPQKFNTAGDGLTHTINKGSPKEGVYNYKIYCNFAYDGKTITISDTISFIVDRTPPTMNNITVPERICYGSNIQPSFNAEDELSKITLYNHSIYAVELNRLISDWQTTDSDNPSIDEDQNGDPLNMTIGSLYYIKAKAQDEAGNWGREAESDDFLIISDNLTECIRDNAPPTITIKTEPITGGLKITMLCSDESGCDEKLIGTSFLDESCNATQLYPETGIIITRTKRVCWNVSDTKGNRATGSKIISLDDEDGDGVSDNKDTCPDTPYGTKVDLAGCPVSGDDDNDRIPDIYDICPGTPIEEVDLVDADGCAPSQRDIDNDGVSDNLDKCPGTPVGEAADTEGCGDSQKDSDDDGIDDAYEKRYNLDPFNSADADQDPDEDDLTNLEEYNYFKQTGRDISPREKDTDGDGYSDGYEVNNNYDPTNPFSKPRGKALSLTFIILGLLLMIGGAGYTVYMRSRIGELPPTPPPTARPLPPALPPSRAQIEAAEARRRMLLDQQRRRKGLDQRRAEIVERRRKEKAEKRSKFFEAFAPRKPKKPPVMPAKLAEAPPI